MQFRSIHGRVMPGIGRWSLLSFIVLLMAGTVPAGRQAFSHLLALASLSQVDTAHGRDSIGRWLWPGAFEMPPAGTFTETPFVASGRRYVAVARSNGLLVRRDTRAEHAIDIQFAGAVRGAAAQLSDEIPGKINILAAAGGRRGSTSWQRYSTAMYRNVYPGIDARFRANAGDVELDFLVAPGADPARIRLAAGEGTRFAMDAESGDILATRLSERFRLRRPRAFQSAASGPREIAVRAVTDGDSVRFELGRYDRALPLTIDPLVATWSTYLGTNTDAGYDNSATLATDADGNLYVGGLTQFSTEIQPSDSFPTTPSSLDPPNPWSPGDNCAYQCGYVLKLSPTHEVLYGALMWGMTVKAVAVDAAGSAYITGTTFDSALFPATAGVFDNDPDGQAFVAKISADGSKFVYSALFVADAGNGIAVDAQGDAYVVGQVSSPNLPTTPGSIKPSNPNTAVINQDGFLLKINPAGSALVYGTYLGGSKADVANAVTVDSQGEAIVVGQTASSDFVGLTGSISGTNDAYLIKVSPDGSNILKGRIIGGSGTDIANGVAADGQGGWIACGATSSANLPTSSGAFQTRLLGQSNGWVLRVDANFSELYSTYFGGSATDGCLNIAGDAAGNAYLVGVTTSADLPATTGAFQQNTSGITAAIYPGLSSEFYMTADQPAQDAYVAELSADGSVIYMSYLGGYLSPLGYAGDTSATGIAASPTGALYVSGATGAVSFPVTDEGLRKSIGGQRDGFVTAFAPLSMIVTTPSLLPNAPLQLPYHTVLTASGGSAPYTWTVVGSELPSGITLSSDGTLSGAPTSSQPATYGYQFTAKAIDATGHTAYKSLFIDVIYPLWFTCNGTTCIGSLTVGVEAGFQPPKLARGIQPQVVQTTGKIPPGFVLNSAGGYEGQATTPGEYKFSFNVSDSVGHHGTEDWDVLVTASEVPGATLSVTPAAVTVGQSFTLNWSSVGTAGCIASGGGAGSSPWSGTLLPVFGHSTDTASKAGSFVYSIGCADGGTSLQTAQATLTVKPSGELPALTLSSTSLIFGSQLVDTSSTGQVVTLTNSGTGPLTLAAITLTGGQADDYGLSSTCGSSLAVKASCTVSVTFKPVSSGSKKASISIDDNATNSPQTVALSGTGAAGTSGSRINLNPTALAFGDQASGATSSAKAVTITNSGVTSVSFSSIALAGPQVDDFGLTTTCGSTLAANASCTVAVTFKPVSAGVKAARISIADSASGSPQTVSLSGTGTTGGSAPAVTLSSTSLAFGSQKVDTPSSAQSVTLTNGGAATLSSISIKLTGGQADDFTVANTCGSTLAAKASCSVSITFKPVSTGAKAASISVADNASGSPQAVTLSGTGT